MAAQRSRDWSEAFRRYIEGNFRTHQDAAKSLKEGKSKVYYWCRGSYPREETRDRIERWSKGAVPARLPPAERPSSATVSASVKRSA